ncbi:hypothetical protein WJX74_009581 [Apatococcus lobatus]|uniref:lipoyl(octanoyl) transferase n=1 Tax=Apatococcus lobatus TaxID=904363 RepID=A0AAW1RB24_9CHLO
MPQTVYWGQLCRGYLVHHPRRQRPGQSSQRVLLITAAQAFKKNSCTVFDLSSQLIPYEEAWQWQRAHVQHMICQLSSSADSDTTRCATSDAILLLQHPPVFTLGSGSTLSNLQFDPADPPAPLFRTERGGEVTAHSPGQLVAYPLLNLRNLQQDLHWYLRSLEEVIIRCLYEVGGVQGTRLLGMTGVWVEDAKIAAIGVRVSKWITYHGLALNVSNDLSFFDHIVPCGLEGKRVTNLSRVIAATGKSTDGYQHASLQDQPTGYDSADMMMRETSQALIASMAEVFNLNIKMSPCKTWTDMKSYAHP